MQKVFIFICVYLLIPIMVWGEKQQVTNKLTFDKFTSSVDNLETYGYKWDKESSTLTLKDFNMVYGEKGNAITVEKKVTIFLIGNNKIELNGNVASDPHRAIYHSADSDPTNALTIDGKGSGTLTLVGSDYGDTTLEALLQCSHLNIDNATIIVEKAPYNNAIDAYYSLKINSSTITVKECGGNGLYTLNGSAEINNSTINIIKSGKGAIDITRGDLSIKESEISIGTLTKGHGISATKNVNISKSTVIVDKPGQSGIFVNEDIRIEESEVTVNSTQYYSGGLYASGSNSNISISNGSVVTVNSATYFGVAVTSGTIKIDNSKLSIDKVKSGIVATNESTSNQINVNNSYIDVFSRENCFDVQNGSTEPNIDNSFIWEKEKNNGVKTGTIYGDYTLKEDLTINENEVFVISEGANLTVEGTLTNKGELKIGENAQLDGNGSFVNESKPIIETPTADMITIPNGLTYTGEDLSTTANSAISLSMSILGETVSLEVNGWMLTIEPAEVKNAGTYTIKYTKEGKTVSKTFEVAKAEKTEFATPKLEGSITYGVQLSTIDLPEGWKWEKETDIPTVTNSGYSAIYTVKDYNNYNWSKIEGYQEDKQEVTRNITVSVTKATGDVATDYTEPSDLSAIYGQILADVTLPDGWTWDAPETSVGNVITNPNSFAATFTPDDLDNYEVFKKELPVTVNKADLSVTDFQFEAPSPEELVYDGNKKAASITTSLIDNNKITIKYKDASDNITSEAPTKAGTYTVIIDVAESDNYNKLTDMANADWTFTIIPVYTITIDPSITNGTIKADKETAQAGETVTLTVSPATNHQLSSLSYSWTEGTVILTEAAIIMPAGDVTVTATFSAIPVTPPVYPVPTYYTVTLPAIEGATTDPVAGSYEIEGWDSFHFYLTLEDDYDQSKPIVTTNRGETLLPHTNDGAYVVKSIRSDVSISINGIVKNTSVSNENINMIKGLHISNNMLYITIFQPETVRIYTFNGTLKLQKDIPVGETIINLTPNTYIIGIGDKHQKVIIR